MCAHAHQLINHPCCMVFLQLRPGVMMVPSGRVGWLWVLKSAVVRKQKRPWRLSMQTATWVPASSVGSFCGVEGHILGQTWCSVVGPKLWIKNDQIVLRISFHWKSSLTTVQTMSTYPVLFMLFSCFFLFSPYILPSFPIDRSNCGPTDLVILVFDGPRHGGWAYRPSRWQGAHPLPGPAGLGRNLIREVAEVRDHTQNGSENMFFYVLLRSNESGSWWKKAQSCRDCLVLDFRWTW